MAKKWRTKLSLDYVLHHLDRIIFAIFALVVGAVVVSIEIALEMLIGVGSVLLAKVYK